ncbi:MAG TPA: AroM family protein [Gemmatimonadaceae bacterium]|nr:AroM family protein [Gemmatimonadaceae bacterium]
MTIGQSPRPDLVAAFAAYAPGARVEVRGALDGLSAGEVDALARVPTDYPLLVRLADGTTREIGRDALHPRVVHQARALAADGAAAVAIACAGDFPDVPCEVPVVLPGRVVPAVTRALGGVGRIGIVTPVAGQVPAATAKWRADGFDPIVVAAPPDDDDALDHAAETLRAAGISLAVLDCMGHADDAARRLQERSGARVLLAQSLAARVAGELVRAPSSS